jgi:hypothetical protein
MFKIASSTLATLVGTHISLPDYRFTSAAHTASIDEGA